MDSHCSFQLTDAEWRVVEPVLAARADIADVTQGRRTLDGILWVMHTGAEWKEMPRAYGEPHQVNERFRTWALSGVLDELLDRLEAQTPSGVSALGADSSRHRSNAA
jgi:transposase